MPELIYEANFQLIGYISVSKSLILASGRRLMTRSKKRNSGDLPQEALNKWRVRCSRRINGLFRRTLQRASPEDASE